MKAITLSIRPVKNIFLMAILLATAITITLNVPDGTTVADISIKTGITGTGSTTTIPGSTTLAVPHSSTVAAPPSSTATTPKSSSL